jgi:hypothetical protein
MAGLVVGHDRPLPVSSLVAQLDTQSFMADDVGIVQSLTARSTRSSQELKKPSSHLDEVFFFT